MLPIGMIFKSSATTYELGAAVRAQLMSTYRPTTSGQQSGKSIRSSRRCRNTLAHLQYMNVKLVTNSLAPDPRKSDAFNRFRVVEPRGIEPLTSAVRLLPMLHLLARYEGRAQGNGGLWGLI